jgi:hypothetical protein
MNCRWPVRRCLKSGRTGTNKRGFRRRDEDPIQVERWEGARKEPVPEDGLRRLVSSVTVKRTTPARRERRQKCIFMTRAGSE